jgi:hypothetical protein
MDRKRYVDQSHHAPNHVTTLIAQDRELSQTPFAATAMSQSATIVAFTTTKDMFTPRVRKTQ